MILGHNPISADQKADGQWKLPRGGTTKWPRSKWRAEDIRFGIGVLGSQDFGSGGDPRDQEAHTPHLVNKETKVQGGLTVPGHVDSPFPTPSPGAL